jgi:hypothetical protein
MEKMKSFALFFKIVLLRAKIKDYRRVIPLSLLLSAILLMAGCATMEEAAGLNTAGKTAQLRAGMEYKQVEAILGPPKSSQTAKGSHIVRWNLHEYGKGWVPYDMVFDARKKTLLSWSANEKEYLASQQKWEGIQGAPGNAPATKSKGSPDTGAVSGAKDIVGKWCYMSNITAANSGRISNRCFTLNPNGTYEYYGETSSGGQYGSSVSQESDRGTWTATATTLEANSAKHGKRTYRLEKKNHPKTKDPMLIIEGDAYVTYYQKASW